MAFLVAHGATVGIIVCGNDEVTYNHHCEASDAKRPERPRPPSLFSEDTSEYGAHEKAIGGGSTEDAKDDTLACVWFAVRATEDGKGIGEEDGRTDALKSATDIEKDNIGGVSVRYSN